LFRYRTITKIHVIEALRKSKLESSKPSSWRSEELLLFVKNLRKIAKPTIIVANKVDLSIAEDNKGVIKYIPGDPDFKILDSSKLTTRERKGLEYIREKVLKKWGSTGVQQAINKAVLEKLSMIAIYPVEDPIKLTDHKGNVLPDVYLVRKGTTARELAYKIHTDLGKTFLYAIDVRTKRRLGEDYVLKDNDVISIVAAKGR